MSGDIGIGRLLQGDALRDAIHVAVAPVVAGETLDPGQGLVFTQKNDNEVRKGTVNTVGVVDPFLKGYVRKGQRFWMFLNPGSINSLRHDWTHPAFGPEKVDRDKIAAKQWLEKFAESQRQDWGMFEGIMTKAVRGDGSWCGDDDNAESFNAQKQRLLREWQTWTGVAIARDEDEIYFSCAC